MADRPITVFLADDNLIEREGARALIGLGRYSPRSGRIPGATVP